MSSGMFIFSPNSSICSLGPWGGREITRALNSLRGRHGRYGRSCSYGKRPGQLVHCGLHGRGQEMAVSVRDGPQQTPDLRVLWSWNSRFQNFEKFILISYLVYVWLLFAGLGLNPGSHVQFMLILLLFLGKCSLWYFCYCWLGWIGSVKQQQPLKSYILTNRCGCSQRTWKLSIEEFSLSLSSCM